MRRLLCGAAVAAILLAGAADARAQAAEAHYTELLTSMAGLVPQGSVSQGPAA